METISNAPDIELVNNVKLFNCNDSLKTLIDRHSLLAYDIINKFSPKFEASGISIQDVKDEKNLLLFKAAKSFDFNKNVKFSTWVGNTVRYECLNMINPEIHKERFKEVSYEHEAIERISDSSSSFNNRSLLDIERVKEILDKEPDKRIKEVFLLRYINDKMTFKQIGQKLGCHSETARNLHEKGRKLLLKKIKEIL